MNRHLLISADCHAGLLPGRYREYLDPQFREAFVGVLMWSSDYPHPEGTWPETHDRMADSFRGIPELERDAMLGGNAAEFYGFDVEKLAPLVTRIGPEKRSFES